MDLLKQLQGKTIGGLSRVRFVLKGETVSDTGPLEIRTTDGTAIVLRSAPDGEALSVTVGPWIDAFSGALSTENQAWIAKHGKWSRFDISAEPAARTLIGAVVTDIEIVPAEMSPQKIAGVQIDVEAGRIRAVVAFDELAVGFESDESLKQ